MNHMSHSELTDITSYSLLIISTNKYVSYHGIETYYTLGAALLTLEGARPKQKLVLSSLPGNFLAPQ